jgi:hypothetical protein
MLGENSEERESKEIQESIIETHKSIIELTRDYTYIPKGLRQYISQEEALIWTNE